MAFDIILCDSNYYFCLAIMAVCHLIIIFCRARMNFFMPFYYAPLTCNYSISIACFVYVLKYMMTNNIQEGDKNANGFLREN